MNYTTNYNMNKPEITDSVDIDDLNDNFDTIDTTLKSLEDDKLNKGDVSEEYNTAKKIEDKIISNAGKRDFHLLLENGVSGLNTLADDWDNYDEIIFVNSYTTTTDILQTHQTFYSDLITASDDTTIMKNIVFTGTDASYRLNFRDTNRNQIYTSYLGDDDQMLKVYGRGKRN